MKKEYSKKEEINKEEITYNDIRLLTSDQLAEKREITEYQHDLDRRGYSHSCQ